MENFWLKVNTYGKGGQVPCAFVQNACCRKIARTGAHEADIGFYSKL